MIAEHPDWFGRVVIGNTALPTGEAMGDGFMMWRQVSQTMDPMDCGALLQRACLARELNDLEADAYRAPFPDESFMVGARQFPLLVPTGPDDPAVPANRAAWRVWEQWTKPVLTLWTPGDMVLGHLQRAFVDRIPGAAGQPHQHVRTRRPFPPGRPRRRRRRRRPVLDVDLASGVRPLI